MEIKFNRKSKIFHKNMNNLLQHTVKKLMGGWPLTRITTNKQFSIVCQNSNILGFVIDLQLHVKTVGIWRKCHLLG